MKIGISSLAFAWAVGVKGYPMPDARLDIVGIVEMAVKHGLEVVQIADNVAFTSEELHEAIELAGENNIEIELGIQGTHPYILRSTLALAMMNNIKTIRTLPHKDDDVPECEELIERLSSVKGEYEKAGVNLSIENCDLYKADELVGVIKTVDSSRIGICFDTANGFGQGEGAMECFEKYKPYINNFHIKDFRIERIDNRMGYTIKGVPCGQGLVDLEKIKKEIPDCSWIIEQWTPWQEDITDTKQLEYDQIVTGIKNLKELNNK